MGEEVLTAELRVEQVRDGFEYRGHVHFGGRWKFLYELRMDRRLDKIDKLGREDPDMARRLNHLVIQDAEGNPVEVPEELAGVFDGLIFPLVGGFYFDPRIRGMNAGKPDTAELNDYGISIGLSHEKKVPLDRERLELLLERHFPQQPL